MPIRPPVPTQTAPPTQAYLDRMARADACIDGCGNVETPYRIEIEAAGFTGFYGCEDCGQFWRTGWRD